MLMFLDHLLFRQTQEAKAKTAYTFLNNDIWEGDAPTGLGIPCMHCVPCHFHQSVISRYRKMVSPNINYAHVF